MREATLFDTELSYGGIMGAISQRGSDGLVGTLEFFPEAGKYHFDGHRPCGVRLSPEETRRNGGRCPRCNRKVTTGVMHRVEDLADRPPGSRAPGALPYRSVVPLVEVIAEVMQVGVSSRQVVSAYLELLGRVGNEYHVLLEADVDRLRQAHTAMLAEAVSRTRLGAVSIKPGYDGEFGTIRVFDSGERQQISGQLGLF
jgi:PHP family Zn ribbon phosphoesterase